MNSTRSLENTRLREELKMLRGALKDLKDDKLIVAQAIKIPESPINNKKQYDKLDSLHSEDIEHLCKFDKIADFSQQDISDSSLKFSLKSVEKSAENLQFKVSSTNPIKKPVSNDPLYDHLLDSSLRFSLDSQSGHFEDLQFKASDSVSGFDKIKPFARNLETIESEQKVKKVSISEQSFHNLPQSSSNNSQMQLKILDNQSLLSEIENLRKENSKLRDQLKEAQSVKSLKEPKIVNVPFRNVSPRRCRIEKDVKSGSKTPKKTSVGRIFIRGGRTRSVSRSKSKSLTPRDISYKVPGSPLTPKRYRHCNICDHLLSKGYSTKYCSKHGIPTK